MYWRQNKCKLLDTIHLYSESFFQTEASWYRVYEASSWQSQRYPTHRQGRYSHARGVPAVQETGVCVCVNVWIFVNIFYS